MSQYSLLQYVGGGAAAPHYSLLQYVGGGAAAPHYSMLQYVGGGAAAPHFSCMQSYIHVLQHNVVVMIQEDLVKLVGTYSDDVRSQGHTL